MKIEIGSKVMCKGHEYKVVGINELKGEVQIKNIMLTTPVDVKVSELQPIGDKKND